MMQQRGFDPRYTMGGMGGAPGGTLVGDYGADYTQENYASRRSRLEDEEEDWIPESYLEKGQCPMEANLSSCRQSHLFCVRYFALTFGQ